MAHGPSKVEIWMVVVSLDDKSLSWRGAIGEIIEEGVGVIALILQDAPIDVRSAMPVYQNSAALVLKIPMLPISGPWPIVG